jgi:hypothetical protein
MFVNQRIRFLLSRLSAIGTPEENHHSEEAMNNKLIAVDNSTEPPELAALANNPDVTLVVTKLDLRRLPEHVKAKLYTVATTFTAPQLQTSGDIYADSATSFSAPQLQTSGDIYARSATNFSAPQLQTSGDIHVPELPAAPSLTQQTRRTLHL